MSTLPRILQRLEQAGSDDAIHQQTLKDTGFWGKQGAGGLFLAKSTGRLMFAQRSNHVQEPLTWGTWGGAMDQHESPKEAALREMFEETKFRGEAELFPMHVFKDAPSGFTYYNYIAVIEDEFTPRLDWENAGFKWVDYGKWPTPLHPGAKILLRESREDIVQCIKSVLVDRS